MEFNVEFSETNQKIDATFEHFQDLSQEQKEIAFNDGKKAEYNAFWDNFQNNGDRDDYYGAFRGWKQEIFKPKYDMNCSTAYQMFAYFDKGGTDRIDLVECLKKLGVTLSTSNATSLQYMCWFCRLNRVGVIDSRGTTGLQQTFNYFYGKTIDKLILKSNGSQTFTQVFQNASSLENLTIEGVIGKNGFNVQWSTKLTHDSLMSIINALQDKSKDTSGTNWVITLGNSNIEKLSTEEIEIARNKGWEVK